MNIAAQTNRLVENLNKALDKSLIDIDSVTSLHEFAQKLTEKIKLKIEIDRSGIDYVYDLIKEDKSLLEEELRAELKLLLINNPEKQMQYCERAYLLEKIISRYDQTNPLSNFCDLNSSDEEPSESFKGIVKEESKDTMIDKL